MPDAPTSLMSFQSQPLAVLLGTNEIASAVAVALTRAKYKVVMSHDPFPPVIRRGMAFHEALYGDFAELSGIAGERAETLLEIAAVTARKDKVAVTSLSLTDLLALRVADVLIDARMQKHRMTPDFRGLARITIGLGPKFVVGANCDIAIETRPSRAGAIVQSGATEEPDGAARRLGDAGRERFVYSQRAGIWRTPVEIGMWVPKNFVIGRHAGAPVFAPLEGIVRGVARDSTFAPAGVKIVEIDPRDRAAASTETDERGRVLANATLAAMRLHAARRCRTKETAARETA